METSSPPGLTTTTSMPRLNVFGKSSIVFYGAQGKNGKASMCKLRRFLSKCDIVVVKKNCSNSMPCVRCTDMLKRYGLRRVYYSFDGDLKMEKVSELNSDHVSSKFRKPFKEFNKIVDTQIENNIKNRRNSK